MNNPPKGRKKETSRSSTASLASLLAFHKFGLAWRTAYCGSNVRSLCLFSVVFGFAPFPSIPKWERSIFIPLFPVVVKREKEKNRKKAVLVSCNRGERPVTARDPDALPLRLPGILNPYFRPTSRASFPRGSAEPRRSRETAVPQGSRSERDRAVLRNPYPAGTRPEEALPPR